jgi:hypothetical protein
VGTLGTRTLHRLAGGPRAKPSWDWRTSTPTPKLPGADSPCAVHQSGAGSQYSGPLLALRSAPKRGGLGVLGTSTRHSEYSEYSGPLPGTHWCASSACTKLIFLIFHRLRWFAIGLARTVISEISTVISEVSTLISEVDTMLTRFCDTGTSLSDRSAHIPD